jgi:tryptophan synthase alpha chain
VSGQELVSGQEHVSGQERLSAAFARAAAERRSALTVFLAAGDPDYDTTIALARAAVEAGADIIELGAPFSDPLADGPVIQAAYTRALAAGASTAATLACAGTVARETDAPVVLMVALNCVLAYGTERFCADAAAAGVAGLLVPDLLVEDAGPLRQAARNAGLGTVFLVGPDSGSDRVAAAVAASTGFAYLLRRRGITGEGAGAAGVDLARRIRDAREAGPAPIAVGFGITTPQDAAEVAGIADGVIVGSVLVDAAFRARSSAPDPDRGRSLAVRHVAQRVADLAAALGATKPPTDRRPTTATTEA